MKQLEPSDKTAPLTSSEIRLFREMVDSSQELFWQVDEAGFYRYLNPAWENVFGYALSEMLGRSFSEFQPPEIAARDLAYLAEAMTLPSFTNYETTLLKKDGSPVYLLFSGKQVYREDGTFFGTQGIAHDMTRRKHAELELKSSEERYRKLSDSAFEGIMIHEKGEVLEVNQAFITMFGFKDKSEILGLDSFQSMIAPRSREMIRQRIQIEEPPATEVYCLRKDGSEFIGMTQSRTVLFQGRKCRIVTMSDITDQKQAEAALAGEKERLAVTLRSIGDGVIATDTEGRVVILNVIAENLTGWTQVEAAGKPLAEIFRIIHEGTRVVCENPVEKVLATGENIELANHTVLISRDGTERIIEDSGAPIRNIQGQTIGVVLVFRDMTEKKKLMEAAQRTQKLESLGLLAGGIAHDFNNLLTGIYGYIDLSLAQTKDTDIAQYLESSISTIERARSLTQQLLTFAKGGTPIRTAGNLFPLVQETVNFALSGTSVTALFDVETDLKPSFFDRNQICQVIDNLVINAQQAMPLGGNILVTARNMTLKTGQVANLALGEYVHIAIRDNGIGIPAELLPRIFDPFFTTKQKGSGLGLATSFSIMTQHDGYIEVQSESGKGTTFHLYLPNSSSAPVLNEKEKAPALRAKGVFLIMDDEPVVLETFGKMFHLLGFEVLKFSEGQAVLDFLKLQPAAFPGITAAMLDLTIRGGMGGKEVATEIRKLSSTLPIFVSSGYADDPIMESPQNYGINGSICKPFRIGELSALLQKNL